VSQAFRDLLTRRAGPALPLLEHHPDLASTNDRLRELARAHAPEWSVVVADRQWAGRGRARNAWASPPGNLFLSVLLRPAIPAEHVTLLPLLAGAAVAEALEEWQLTARLKWPNDVLLGDRKLAGILVESSSGASGIDWAAVGIGVNVNLDPASLGEPLAERVTSMAFATGRPAEPLEVGASVLARLAVWYHSLQDGRHESVLQAWRARSVPWWGRNIEIRTEGGVVRGLLDGVDSAGALLLRSVDGPQVRVVSGEDVRLSPPV
jgi:BirA family biotin operon repressor/biotin-[acetyl-CoA-carboxylase] ligase